MVAADPEAGEPVRARFARQSWADRVRHALAARSSEARGLVEQALRACPNDPELLLLAALAALAGQHPDRALAFLKRYQKRYVPTKAVALLTAVAAAQQGHFKHAWATLQAEGLDAYPGATRWFVG
ncbi:MAG: hypothetical protein ACREFO_12725, partial [Acetobacteraceae bacterium]